VTLEPLASIHCKRTWCTTIFRFGSLSAISFCFEGVKWLPPSSSREILFGISASVDTGLFMQRKTILYWVINSHWYFTINFEKQFLWSIIFNRGNVGETWITKIVQPFVILKRQTVSWHCRRVNGVHILENRSLFLLVRCSVGLVSRIQSSWKTEPPLMDLSTNNCWSTTVIRPIFSLLILRIKSITWWGVEK